MHHTECTWSSVKLKVWKEYVHKDIIKAFYYLKNDYKSKLLQGNIGCEFAVD